MEGTFGPNHERQERIATALRRIEGGSCHLMGVLNVTPDSFHKASRLATVEEAIASGLAMWRDGATWLDVGGESTRPGAEPVNPEQERQRVVPVIKGLREANPDVTCIFDLYIYIQYCYIRYKFFNYFRYDQRIVKNTKHVNV